MTKTDTSKNWFLSAAVLIIMLQICHVLGYMTPSMLMSDIMQELQVEYSLAGLTMTLITAVGGVFMFVGSMVQDKFGTKNILVLAGAIIFGGNLIAVVAPDIWILLLGRFMNGIGFGLMTTGSYTYISAWFKGKAKGMMNSIYLVASSLGTLLSTILAIPLRDMTGSWRYVLAIYAVYAAITTVFWLLFARSNAELDENCRKNLELRKSGKNGLLTSFKEALKIRQVWILIFMFVMIQVAASASLTYAPTYIETYLGVSAVIMSTAVSLRPIFGIIGNFASGVIMSLTGRRKPIIFLALAGGVVAYLLMVNANSTIMLFVAMALTGIFSNLPIPTINTTIMETPKDPTPSLVGACSALVNGIGSLATLCVSPLFAFLTDAVGMKNSLMIMFSVLALSALLSLLLKETGKKAKSDI